MKRKTEKISFEWKNNIFKIFTGNNNVANAFDLQDSVYSRPTVEPEIFVLMGHAYYGFSAFFE